MITMTKEEFFHKIQELKEEMVEELDKIVLNTSVPEVQKHIAEAMEVINACIPHEVKCSNCDQEGTGLGMNSTNICLNCISDVLQEFIDRLRNYDLTK